MEVQQERYMKIAISNHVQFGRIGVYPPVVNVARLVVEEQLKQDHFAYSRTEPK